MFLPGSLRSGWCVGNLNRREMTTVSRRAILWRMTRHIPADASHDCPKCGKPMEPHSIDGISFQRCTGCAGLWLGTPDMERLMGAKSEARAADIGARELGDWTAEIKGSLNCPNDGSQLIRMVNHKQPHVHFESCKVCGGVFLDAGELRDLASFTLIERLRMILRRAP